MRLNPGPNLSKALNGPASDTHRLGLGDERQTGVWDRVLTTRPGRDGQGDWGCTPGECEEGGTPTGWTG